MEELILAYFSGNLSEEEKWELVNWLKEDEKHLTIFSKISESWAIAHIALFDSDKKENFESLITDISSQTNLPRKNKFNNWKTTAKIAASILLLVAIASSFYYIGTKNQLPEELTFYETIVPLGSVSQIILPDSSKVWVNAGSSIRYSNQFNKKNRKLDLRGEAYFEITGDSLKPFIVNTGNLDVTVKGTKFNVKSYEEDSIAQVVLIKGKVDIQVLTPTGEGIKITLKPNDAFTYNKQTNTTAITEENWLYRSASWKEGIISFNNAPFKEIAKDLERKLNIQIRIESRTLQKEVFSGSFAKYATFRDIMKEVDIDNKYYWVQKGKIVIIKNK